MLDTVTRYLSDYNNRSFVLFVATSVLFVISAIYIAYSVKHVEFVKNKDDL